MNRIQTDTVRLKRSMRVECRGAKYFLSKGRIGYNCVPDGYGMCLVSFAIKRRCGIPYEITVRLKEDDIEDVRR